MEQKPVEISSRTTSQGPLINGAFLGCGCHPQEDVSEISHQGERYVPLIDPYCAASHLGHMASYKCALLYAYGKKVLDLGCGAGYGSHFLASFGAAAVVAADPDEKSILYASRTYHHPRVHHVRLDGNRSLPFSDHSFDFVFCSQVIEHIDDPFYLLKEFRRILKPGGFCLVTMPNKDLFSPSGDQSPNQYHINEMNLSQYEALGTRVFPCIRLAGIPQNCLAMNSNNILTLKPNEDLVLEDFQVRSDNLAACENLLLFGHTRAGGKFEVSLPDSQSRLARSLAPYFWDPWVKQWVMMDNYPATRTGQGLTSRSIRRANTMIYSSFNNLYRVEIGFLKGSPFDIEVTLRRGSREGPVVSREVMPIEGNKLRLVFPPVPDSAQQVFYLELRVQVLNGLGSPTPFINLEKLAKKTNFFFIPWFKLLPTQVLNGLGSPTPFWKKLTKKARIFASPDGNYQKPRRTDKCAARWPIGAFLGRGCQPLFINGLKKLVKKTIFSPVPEELRESSAHKSVRREMARRAFLGRGCQPPRLEFQDGKFPVWTFNSDFT